MKSLVKPIYNLVRSETFKHLEPKYHSLLIKLTENYLCLVVFTFQTDQKPQFVGLDCLFSFLNNWIYETWKVPREIGQKLDNILCNVV